LAGEELIELVGKGGESYLKRMGLPLAKFYILSELVQKDPPRNKFKYFKLDPEKGVYFEIDPP
jgi:hypothetical protein